MTDEPSLSEPLLPPFVKGLPVVGSALRLRADPAVLLASLYREYGSVFRLMIMGRQVSVLAGIDANRFLAQYGDHYLSNLAYYQPIAREFGAAAMIPGIEGAEHGRQRKIGRRGVSREMILNENDTVVAFTEHAVREWEPGVVLPLYPTLRRLIADQIGILLTGRAFGEILDDLLTVLKLNQQVHVYKTHPALLLRKPAYRAAREAVLAYTADLLDWHRSHPPISREQDLVDDLLAGMDETGAPYPDQALIASLIGGYFSGIEPAAATASFMLIAILRQPDLLPPIYTEIDAVFDKGGLHHDSLRRMTTLHRVALETLRLVPPIPFTPRIVVNPFEFAGYPFATGDEVIIAHTVTHFEEAFFSNPAAFEISRREHMEAQKIGAFAPYGLGAHTCLGAGMVEVLLMTVIATILRTVELELLPTGADVTITADPLPNPGSKIAVRVVETRKPARISATGLPTAF